MKNICYGYQDYAFQEVLGKEKKNIKKNYFHIFGFTMKNMNKKSNILKIT